MATVMLNEVINDGEKISLMDGSIWQINPGDMPTVCTWTPTAEIEISSNDDSTFDHTLTNKNINVSVNAMKLN
jgi:hypothetical protein